MKKSISNLTSFVALAQAFLYLVTGVWPIASMSTFEAITGPKTDDWLVKTVAVLVIIVGTVLAVAAIRQAITFEILLLAVGSAVGLTIIDLIYFAKRVISAVYLLDAVAELLLVALWVSAWMMRKRESGADQIDHSQLLEKYKVPTNGKEVHEDGSE